MADAGAGAGAGEGDKGAAGAAGAGAGEGDKGAAAPWHGLTAPEDAAYVANKGWKAPADIVNSYRGAEKLIGRDPNTLLQLPRADDPEAFLGVMNKLGRPEAPDKYEFAKTEGVTPDEGYMTWARGAFHKAGLTASQVKQLSGEHNAYVKSVLEQQQKDYNLAVEADKKALLGEWKGGHERMMNAAQTAAKNLGFTKEMIDGIERSVGYAGTWKFFADLGKKMGEDNFEAGGDKTARLGDTMTPDEAKAEWQKMTLDAVAMAALKDRSHPGHTAAFEKQKKLFGIMYPA